MKERARWCFIVWRQREKVDRDAHVAQLVEHILGKDEVISSILIMGSSRRAGALWRAAGQV